MKRILFVCTGNICRSPLAEALMRAKASNTNGALVIDSAGLTPDHVGQHADARMRRTAQKRGVTINHRSRAFTNDDFDRFDLIVAMDDGHMRTLERMRGSRATEVRKMLEYDPESPAPAPDVPDPWYGSLEGFERVYEMIDRATSGLTDALRSDG